MMQSKREPLEVEDVPFYMDATRAVLRTWLRACESLGYIPSCMDGIYADKGRASYQAPHTFEDRVAFAIDIASAIDSTIDPGMKKAFMLYVVGGGTSRQVARECNQPETTMRDHMRCQLELLTLELYARELLPVIALPPHAGCATNYDPHQPGHAHHGDLVMA